MPPTTVSPSVTEKPEAGTIAVRDKAEDAIFRQLLQWQAAVMSGGAETCIVTRPQRHEPDRGRGMAWAGSLGRDRAHTYKDRSSGGA